MGTSVVCGGNVEVGTGVGRGVGVGEVVGESEVIFGDGDSGNSRGWVWPEQAQSKIATKMTSNNKSVLVIYHPCKLLAARHCDDFNTRL